MSTNPTPPMPPIEMISTTDEKRGRRTRLLAAFGLAVAIATVSVGGVALAGAGAGQEEAAPQVRTELNHTKAGGEERSSDVRKSLHSNDDFDEVDPFAGMTDEEVDNLSDDDYFAMLDEAYGDDDFDESDGDYEDSAESDGDYEDSAESDFDEADPFAGMTDEEVDNLSDDDYFAMLDEAGIDINEDDSDNGEYDETDAPSNDGQVDPFAGMTDEEVDNLSDEDFFAMLEEAGIDIDDDIDDDIDGDHDGDSHDHDEFGEEAVLGAFEVNGDSIDLSNAPDQETADQAKAIWDRFVKLIPADQRQMLTSFELNPEEAAGAYVYPAENDPSNWVMGVSLGLGEDLDYVLIHEFAHLLTLQASEVPPAADADPGTCPTYFTGEGCALSGTTMAEFVQKFWPQSQIDEINRLQESEDYDAFDRFYEEHSDDFVTDYATTNPAEDLAETFTVFVLNDRPTGSTIADQKVNLLWADADMVALRAEILANR